MPKKGKKGKKGKKAKKSKAKVANADLIIKNFMKCYERNCSFTESQMCPWVKKNLGTCVENGTVLNTFIIEAVALEKEGDIPVLIEPLLTAVRQERYTHIKDLHIWQYPMSHENVATLSLLLEKPFYPVKSIELMDCLVDAYSLKRLSQAINVCSTLTHINLDYNEVGNEGCKNLCSGIEGNRTLLSISMCYCGLGPESGKHLGHIASITAVREFMLDGNDLQCEGAVEIIKLCVDQAEYEAFQRAEQLRLKAEDEARKTLQEQDGKTLRIGSGVTTDEGEKSDQDLLSMSPPASTKKKKKKGKKKKKKGPPPPPPVGPWIYKLHLADNGIDGLGNGTKFAPIICMRLFKKLLMYSECIEEVDLDDNLVGDLAAKEIVEALEYRKEEKMKGVKLRTTHRLNSDTFNNLVKLGAGLKKKKKGKKKKK